MKSLNNNKMHAKQYMNYSIIFRAIAVTQIIGSSSSATYFLPAVFSGNNSWFSIVVFMLMYTIFFAAFVSGLWMWNEEKRGYNVSLMVQIIQIPVLSTHLILYKFVFGFGIVIRMIGDGKFSAVDVGAQSHLLFFGENLPFMVGINIWATLAAICIWRKLVATSVGS